MTGLPLRGARWLRLLGAWLLLSAAPLAAADVRTLLTKLEDGDARDAKLTAAGTGKFDSRQDEGYALLRTGSTPLLTRSPGQPLRIVVDRTKAYQTMLGHGAAMTDASAYVLMNLKAKNPPLFAHVMSQLFSPTAGAGFSFLRLPMGSSDYTATKTYVTYCDQESPDLSKFSIAHDLEYIIPALKEALRLNPEIRILGSPWSPPAWMKTNGALAGVSKAEKAKGATCRLKSECFEVYAEYFVKFIEGYQAAGVEVYGVTLQNEPQFDAAAYPCLRMNEDDQIRLVRLLGRRLAARGLKTKIFVHDHNWALHPNDREVINGDAKLDPVASVTKIYSDAEANPYIAGSSWHCYFGDAETMRRTYQTMHEKFPDKLILCTELSAWGKKRGAWFGDVQWGLAHNWLGGPQNWCQASQQWNLVLDHKYGPTLRADSEAAGLVNVNTDRYDEAKFEREFYAMAQVSRAARPGAVHVAATVQGRDAESLDVAAFALNKTQTSLVVFNKQGVEKALQVQAGGKFFAYQLPARSLVTFVW